MSRLADKLPEVLAGVPAREGEPAWLTEVRSAGVERARAAGFPGPKDEPWRYTPLGRLSEAPFAPGPGAGALSDEDFAAFATGEDRLFEEGAELRVVLVDGRLDPARSDLADLPAGAEVSGLADALARHGAELEAHLARLAGTDGHAFEALNAALFADGLFLRLAPGVELAKPLHLLHVSTGADARFLNLRNLLILGEGAKAAVVEDYAGLEGAGHLVNAVTEIHLDPAAKLEAIRLQREADTGYHLGETRAVLRAGSELETVAVNFGGRVVRNELQTRLVEAGAAVRMYGVSVTHGEQHVENHTLIDHRVPDTTSDEFYKAILDDRSKGVFRGQVLVREGADRTDSNQQNKNILLSRAAEMNTKPELEIYADDVKAAHGATVGQLDPDHIFYLRSRGIGEKEARRLLVQAFARDLLNRIPIEPVRDALKDLFSRRFA